MPRYVRLRDLEKQHRGRVIDDLVRLREQLQQEVIAHRKPGSTLLATWNIREFDSGKREFGRRLQESYHYIAEIISAFDLVALQEINDDLAGLRQLMGYLGPDWDFIATDTTEGVSGNGERMAFVFRKSHIRFRGIAGEVVLPKGQEIVGPEGDAGSDRLQFARTPFTVAFQAGWFKFDICTVHIYYGEDSGEKLARRVAEIRQLAKFFSKRQARQQERIGTDIILLGDFNIVSPEHKTMEALEGEGFHIPDALKDKPSNIGLTKHYDQIAFRHADKRLELGKSGVFEIYKSVFRDDDASMYREFMTPKPAANVSPAVLTKDYRNWRTYQLSDHHVMWIEMLTDFTGAYLDTIRQEE